MQSASIASTSTWSENPEAREGPGAADSAAAAHALTWSAAAGFLAALLRRPIPVIMAGSRSAAGGGIRRAGGTAAWQSSRCIRLYVLLMFCSKIYPEFPVLQLYLFFKIGTY